MKSHDPLALLVCGSIPTAASGDAYAMSQILVSTRDAISSCARSFQNALSRRSSEMNEHVCPFLLRKILELTFVGIQTRVDPVRMTSLLKAQQSSDYDPGVPHSAKFSWTGDVFSDGSPVKNLWSASALKNGVSRSIFGSHVTEIVLKPGVDSMLVNEKSSSSRWIGEVTDTDVVAQMSGQLRELYSALSKGVHAEYLITAPQQFDRVTVEDYFERVHKWAALAAAATHFSEPVFCRLTSSRVFQLIAKCELNIARALDATHK